MVMRASLSTACLFHLPLRRLFALAAEIGFDGIELVMGAEVWLRGSDYVRGLSAEYGLPVVSVHQTLLRFGPSGGGARRMLDATRVALALGSATVVVHTPYVLDWADRRALDWLEQLRVCRQLVRGTGTRLSVENPGWYGSFSPGQALACLPELAAFARWHGLGITLDTCHLGTCGLPLIEAYDLVADCLVNVHLSDLKHLSFPLEAHHLQTVFARHQLPGDGHLGLGAFLAHLAAQGYQRLLTLEAGAVALGVWSPREVRRRLAAALSFMRTAGGATSQTAPGCAPVSSY